MVALKDYTELDEKRLNALYTRSVGKLKELQKQKTKLEKQINKELLNKNQIVKAIDANNDFIRLEDTQEYKEFQSLDEKTKERRIEKLMRDIEKWAD